MSDDWAEAGKRHDTDDGGHWHEPSYPSCVVCRMRDLEEALTKIVSGWMSDTDTLDDVKDAINDAAKLLSLCGWHGHCPKPAGHDDPHIGKRDIPKRDTQVPSHRTLVMRAEAEEAMRQQEAGDRAIGPARNPGLLT